MLTETTYVIFGRRGSGKTTIRLQVIDRVFKSLLCMFSFVTVVHIIYKIKSFVIFGPLNVQQMQHAYDEYNERARATNKSRGHFMVDLCRPGHMTACLRNFQEATGCTDDNWESQFGKQNTPHQPRLTQTVDVGFDPVIDLFLTRQFMAGELWTSADMVDCILAYAVTQLVDRMTDPKSAEGREMLDLIKADARASKQFLLLAHL